MATCGAHVDKCITIIMSLSHNQGDIFPSELIQIIVKLYWELLNTPVLMLLGSDGCSHCRNLEEIWYPSPLGRLSKGESILCKLTEMYLGLRFVDVPCTNMGLIHPELYPMWVKHYAMWYPMILLIPGPLWNHAMLYPESDIELIDGVQVVNGTWEDGINRKVLRYDPKYDSRKVEDFMQWFTDSLNNLDFIAAQNKLI
jgi:hypothetical protein